jgi:hypothetical protein
LIFIEIKDNWKHFLHNFQFIVNGPTGQVGMCVNPKMMELEIGFELKQEMPQSLSMEEWCVMDQTP